MKFLQCGGRGSTTWLLQCGGRGGFPETALPSFHTCLPPLSACPFSSDSVFSCALLCCVLLCCGVLCFIVSGCLCCGCCVALYPPSTWTYFYLFCFCFAAVFALCVVLAICCISTSSIDTLLSSCDIFLSVFFCHVAIA